MLEIEIIPQLTKMAIGPKYEIKTEKRPVTYTIFWIGETDFDA